MRFWLDCQSKVPYLKQSFFLDNIVYILHYLSNLPEAKVASNKCRERKVICMAAKKAKKAVKKAAVKKKTTTKKKKK